MTIHDGLVNGFTRHSIPEPNETIAEDIHIEKMVKVFKHINVYLRTKEKCPFSRGNWIIDFHHDSDSVIPAHCLKLPLEMTREQVDAYLKPLIELYRQKIR